MNNSQFIAIAFVIALGHAAHSQGVVFVSDSTRLSELRVGGFALLGAPVGTGGGYLIGSATGADNSGHSVSSIGGSGGLMHSDNPMLVAPPPFTLNWQQSGNVMNFTATIGPVPQAFQTISMPFDFAIQGTDSWAFNGSGYQVGCANQWSSRTGSGGTYDSIPQPCLIPNTNGGHVGAARTSGPVSWGEVRGPVADVRVEILSSIHYQRMLFYNHFGTHNIELAFGQMTQGQSASVVGRIIVTPKAIPSLTYDAIPLNHQVGYADGNGWAVNVSYSPNHYLTFGPYTRQVVNGNRTATFRLMVDNVTANNAEIAKISVYDPDSGVVRASMTLRRHDFVTPFTYRDFTIPFTPSAGHRLEFRVFWKGGSYLKQSRVVIR